MRRPARSARRSSSKRRKRGWATIKLREDLGMAKAPGVRVIRSIRMKRKRLTLWGPVLQFRLGDIDYGHWWFEIGDRRDPASESYGWWPKTLGRSWRLLRDTLIG